MIENLRKKEKEMLKDFEFISSLINSTSEDIVERILVAWEATDPTNLDDKPFSEEFANICENIIKGHEEAK